MQNGAAGLVLIAVGFEASRTWRACNCSCPGNRRIVVYDLCPPVTEALAKAGLSVTPVHGIELVKGDAGPRRVTRPIYA